MGVPRQTKGLQLLRKLEISFQSKAMIDHIIVKQDACVAIG